jgi:tRNA pseudouridine38-40 synthase
VILNRTAPSALLGRYALHVRELLDITAMRAAAAELTGRHDFAAFGQPDAPGKSTVRDVERIAVQPWKDCLLLAVRGNAFLRQMVRSFVGTLVLAGQGKLSPLEVRAIRESGDRSQCPAVAPPHGLCLVRVDYDGQRYDGNDSSTSNRNTDHEDLFGEAE